MHKISKTSSRKTPKLGQHLLTSSAIAAKIASAAHLTTADTVVEVGPGKGVLTRELLKTGAHVIAIEKDSAMVTAIQTAFPEEIKSGQLELIEGDVRDIKLKVKNFKVVANIPYYITGELLRMFLTTKNQPSTIVFLVQKEVAERIVRSKKESLLSLSVKAYGEPRYIQTVKAGSFNPPPSVDSAILAIENISRKNFKNVSEEKFFELLHTGFGQKRKTLVGNLKRAELYREGMGLDAKIRAEDVPLSTWLTLAEG